jgi:hypothetical protein
MIQVNVTEGDIVRSIKNTKLSPHELALSRCLRCERDKLDIYYKTVKVWLYDDSNYIEYNFASDEDMQKFYDFVGKWEDFKNSTNEEFLDEPFTFTLEEKHDPRNDSCYWAATNFDIERITSRDNTYNKNINSFDDDYYEED